MITVLLLAGLATAWWKSLPPPPVTIVPAEVSRGNGVLTYPKISGTRTMGDAMTQTIATEIDRFAQVFAQPDISGKVTYQVEFNQKGILSVTLQEMYYQHRAAHPMTYLRAFTFSTQAGRVLRLEDLFRPGSDFRSVLDQHMKRQLAERDVPLLTPFTGVQDGQEFYLTADGLVLYYQLYEFTPYVWGFLRFTVPYGDLADLLRPEYRP